MLQDNGIDVICQHNKDGTIYPLRIRIQDEENVYQTYNIKSSKELGLKSFLLPSEIVVTTEIMRFECKIEVFGQDKRVVLHYNKSKAKWYIFY